MKLENKELSQTLSINQFKKDFSGYGTKDGDITFFEPAFDIEDFKKRKELEGFRKARKNFFRFVFFVLGLHNLITILLLSVVPLSVFRLIDIDLNIIIPSYLANVAVQVFALMKAVVKYFDKEDFIQK